MDLKEKKVLSDQVVIHPWETVRIWCLKKILKMNDLNNVGDVLDVGCSDGYTIKILLKGMDVKSITGVDVNLEDSLILEFEKQDEKMKYVNSFDKLDSRQRFDTVFALDVLEHIKEDKFFLVNDLIPLLKVDGSVLVSVPAFSWLFSDHDRFLEHYRRYDLKSFQLLLTDSGLQIKSFGYFFFTLIFVRVFQRLVKSKTKLLDWRHGGVVTNVVEFCLKLDSAFVFMFLKLGIKLPGLSLWAVCKRKK